MKNIGKNKYLASQGNRGEIPLTFILVALFFIGQQIIEGITFRDNISNLAHVVGGIVGGFLGYGLNVQARFDRWKNMQPGDNAGN